MGFKLFPNDPVWHCDVHKKIGCAHVDGFLCDFPDCSILSDYRKEHERYHKLKKVVSRIKKERI